MSEFIAVRFEAKFYRQGSRYPLEGCAEEEKSLTAKAAKGYKQKSKRAAAPATALRF
jgi:hypothetical protein